MATIKLRFISLDQETRALVLEGGTNPMLDLTLKVHTIA